MAKAKKKQATRTAKKGTRKASSSRCAKGSKASRKTVCNRERNHVYIVTALGMIATILLCASAAMMMI